MNDPEADALTGGSWPEVPGTRGAGGGLSIFRVRESLKAGVRVLGRVTIGSSRMRSPRVVSPAQATTTVSITNLLRVLVRMSLDAVASRSFITKFAGLVPIRYLVST